MIDGVLYFLYLFRPIAYVTMDKTVAGFSFLEIFAAVSFVLLMFLWVTQLGSRRGRQVTAVDLFILLYILWVVGAYLTYFEKANVKDLLKFLLPFITYVVIRNSLRSKDQYIKLLWIMVVGFSIPIIATTLLISMNKGVYVQNYWTKLYRFTGTYPNPHDLGHNMTFFIMLVGLYVVFLKEKYVRDGKTIQMWRKVFIGLLVGMALYCLYKSYVRTAYLGLIVFIALWLYFKNKKLFFISIAGMAAVITISWSLVTLIFHDVAEVAEGSRDTEKIAGGRPYIWKHNLTGFSNLTIDRQFAGVGVGNRYDVLSKGVRGEDNFWNSHNDYLEVMIQTGIIGFLLFLTMQILLFRAVVRLPKSERGIFIAIFLAVTFMNLASNSYVTRFGLGQSFYMILAFIEFRRISGMDTTSSG